MRGRLCALFAVGLAVVSVIGCEVHTEVRAGGLARPHPEPRTRGGSSEVAAPKTVATQESSPSQTDQRRAELRPVTERELTAYRSLISGEDDRVVLDPKLVNATDNIYTRSFNATVGALESHAAKYDVSAVMASRPPCEMAIENILAEQANDPIRKDEDDVQYQRRRDAGAKGLESFRKALGSPSDASRADLKLTYGLLVTKSDDRGTPAVGLPRPRSPLMERIDGVGDKGLCHAKYLLVVNEWWKRQRAELDTKRQAGEAAKDTENRKAVLARRFAPVALECSDSWRATSTKCDELPGLSDDERGQCKEACKVAAEEGFSKSFSNAVADCFVSEAGGAKACELKKPAGSTIADEEVTKAVASCKSECTTKVREAKQQAGKEHQECLGFCRDLNNGFCSMTQKPKQPACIDRCIRIKCSGS